VALHRRARASPLRQLEIVSHAELVSIADDRSPRQGEHQAVRKLEAPPVTVEHRRKTPADAAIIELHLLRWAERVEYLLALLLGKAAEIELIMIAQEHSPLRGGRPRPRGIKGLDQKLAIGRSHCVEQSLIDLKVEHHMHAIACIAEILHVGFWQHVGFRQNNRIAFPPLQKLAKQAQHVILLDQTYQSRNGEFGSERAARNQGC
jgi:hypothetical protein